MRDHHKVRAFELADEVCFIVYRLTADFPTHEMYGLCSQMRRAAVSVASNIVEGCGRETEREYRRFPVIAFGSLRELHYQFTLSVRLGYMQGKNYKRQEAKIEETEKVLGSLIRKISQSIKNDQNKDTTNKQTINS